MLHRTIFVPPTLLDNLFGTQGGARWLYRYRLKNKGELCLFFSLLQH